MPEPDEMPDQEEIPAVTATWPRLVSRHRKAKVWAKRGLTATSVGVQGAQIGLGNGAMALMTGVAGAASATGFWRP